MGIFGLNGFNGNNDYGITRKELRQFEKELKNADKKDNSFQLNKSDYKEIREAINNGTLGAYLDRQSDAIRQAMGLAFNGKVDDIREAQGIAQKVEFAPEDNVDVDKVLRYIENSVETPKNIAQQFNETFNPAVELSLKQQAAFSAQRALDAIDKALG